MFPFNRHNGLIVVSVEIEGPLGIAFPWLALDTGAVQTILSDTILRGIGYDPAQATQHIQMMSASTVFPAPQLTVTRLTALGQVRTTFPIVAHTLPHGAAFDGLLGLDFFRGQTLKIDFRNGMIDLT